MDRNALRENIASVQHKIWAHWMNYLFEVCEKNDDGSYTIPLGKVIRWKKQIEASFDHLSEDEKESDRRIADWVLDILETD